ncbi:MAG: hypothetical protein P1Q69_12600 [Candidatus Thorarchaeota archaeon]|nr:hypothetical protein [Candidatus Thorarchaeota archaeon]
MFRTIMALLVALLVAIIIGAFQILGMDVAAIQALLQDPNLTNALSYQGALLFAQLLFPYTYAIGGIFTPLVALGVAGFIAGLISKSGVRMLVVSIVSIALFFLGYALLSLGLALDTAAFTALLQNIAIDIGVAFGLLFIPGIIGASLTSEDY